VDVSDRTLDDGGPLDAMRHVRDALDRQLAEWVPSPGELDPAELVRFAPDLPEALSQEARTALTRRVAELEPWLQGPFLLGGDLVVRGTWRTDHRWEGLRPLVPASLANLQVLDVGSNAGYDAFMFNLLGASRVMACEPFEFHEQALFLQSVYGTQIDFRRMGWQSLDPLRDGRFDLVHCHGVLYHEVDPMGLLRRLRDMVTDDGTLIFGTMMLADPERSECARFVPGAFCGDPTWWWVPGRLAIRWMLEAAGFAIELAGSDFEGPPGDFAVVNGYFRARPVAPAFEPPVQDHDPGRHGIRNRFPLGHFYSAVPDTRELAAEPRRSQVWPAAPEDPPGIDWRGEEQARLCTEVFAQQSRLEFPDDPTADPTEYFTTNDQYPALDAWLLEAFLRHLRPRRMIEVGSGFSTLVAARVNRESLDGSMRLTCVEPYPRDFLRALPGVAEVEVRKIQDVPLELFDELGADDVLFVDTSHTVKTGGDVTWIFHRILPRLRQGVYVHLHDVFLPGDYPKDWVLDGWGWNELYLAQSFLAFNSAFEVVLGAQWMIQRRRAELLRAFPDYPRHEHRGGAALWIRRT
jgi:SAM-dependent methyltransferase/predicted O-methyltransferase YrrM